MSMCSDGKATLLSRLLSLMRVGCSLSSTLLMAESVGKRHAASDGLKSWKISSLI